MTAIVDGNGKRTAFSYDNMNRLLSKTPDASVGETAVQYTYTATGQRASMTDGTGTTTYQYDGLDRLRQKVTPFGTLTYAYDAVGRVTSVVSSNAGGVNQRYRHDSGRSTP